MFNKYSLKNIKKPVPINKVTLSILQEFYKDSLCSCRCIYNCNDDKIIQLDFYEENLCHLLGIQHIVPKNLKNKYTGQNGYDSIINNQTTFEVLKSFSKSKFNCEKPRFKFFPYILQIIKDPDIIIYNKDLVIPHTNIRCDFMLYKSFNNCNLHLGITKDSNSAKSNSTTTYSCIPVTFLVEKNLGDKFIKDQQPLSIKNITIETKSSINTKIPNIV